MKAALICSVLLLAAQAIADIASEEEVENPRYRQVRNQEGTAGGSRPNRRPPPPPAYYVETPSENGRRVYQIHRADEKIHEQLGVLGAVAQNDNRRRTSPAEPSTNQNQNQNQNGRTQNQSQTGKNPSNRPPQNNRW